MIFSKKTNLAIASLIVIIAIFLAGCDVGAVEGAGTSMALPLEPDTTKEIIQEVETKEKQEEVVAEEQLSQEEIKIRDRILLEEELKKEMGPFFVPLAPIEKKENPGIQAKGFYVTANSAGLQKRMEGFIDMVDATELNAMVIDVKNDHGLMTYPSEIAIVKEVMADHFEPVRDIEALMARLEEKGIYPIARIVVFRDPYLPEFYPEWAIQKKEGGIWRDKKGFAWVNPYEKKIWDYNIAIAKEAALMGFREIQFDYVRFPEDAQNFDAEVSFPGQKGIPKDEIIRDFLAYAAEELKEYNVHVSADVFGVIATYFRDKDEIGQNWEKITAVVDYIYPMVYPSHYSDFFGIAVPDAHPHETILRAMEDAIKRNASVKDPAPIRPWLQGFTASWVRGNISYGPVQIRQQIDAALERGIEEFFIWNAANQYDGASFLSEEEASKRAQQAVAYRDALGLDFLGRTSLDALEQYLVYVSAKNGRQAYPVQSTDFAMDFTQFSEWASGWTFDELAFAILDQDGQDFPLHVEAEITLFKGSDEFLLENASFALMIENNIWKVRPDASFIEALSRTSY